MEAGEVLDGRFLVEGPLDQGGMGSIWKATNRTTGGTVAVKVLRLDAYTQGRFSQGERVRRRAELLRRFEREGMILDELDHPAIPRLLHRGYRDEEPYLVMEYVEGVTLREFLDRRRPIPLDAACVIAAEIADALSHAHDHGVVHRDLKPGNVVLADDGTVQLLDFGIAYLTDPDATRYTALGATPGSAGYMAPEQLRGQQEVTASVDYYALGCVIFELVTGGGPFEDKPDRNKDTQHVEDLPPRIRDINFGLPQDLDDLVRDLLGKSPADRPSRIDGVLAVLRSHLPAPGDAAPEPELDPDPTARYRMPGGSSPEPVRGRHADRVPRRPSRRRGTWLGRNDFAALLLRARAELEADGPGSSCERLAQVLAQATVDWGLGDFAVSDAQLACADTARLEGSVLEARPLYEQVAAVLDQHADPAFRALALEARVGIAECRVPEGDLSGAANGWMEVATSVLALPAAPRRLISRCHEVALELVERGCGMSVTGLLARLTQ